MASPTLRELTGMTPNPSPISDSALVLIDCQQTYREGIMQLVGVEPALQEAAELLRRFREAGRPVIHIMHDAGPGTPYDVSAPIGQIAEFVAPIEGETVIVKNYPSAFEKTALDAELRELGVKNVIYAGFMTHMCVNSTTRASFNHGSRQHRGGGSHGDAVDSKSGERQGRLRRTASGCQPVGARRHVRRGGAARRGCAELALTRAISPAATQQGAGAYGHSLCARPGPYS